MAFFKNGHFKKTYNTLQELRDDLITGELKNLTLSIRFHILQNCINDGKYNYIDERKELSIKVKKDKKGIPRAWL